MFQFPANPTIGQQFSPAPGITYEWNGTGWIFLGNTPASVYPPGVVVAYAGVAPPITPIPFQGWLLCDGSAVSRTTYAALFAIVSNTFGNGDGSTTFNLPDLRGRVVAGVDNMGTGGFANRLTAAALGTPGTINAQGGVDMVQLSAAEMPSHGHGYTDPTHGHGVSDPTHSHGITDPGHSHTLNGAATAPASGGFMAETNNSAGNVSNTGPSATGIGGTHSAGTSIGIVGSTTNITIHAAGGNQAHLNVQPTICLNYLIKT